MKVKVARLKGISKLEILTGTGKVLPYYLILILWTGISIFLISWVSYTSFKTNQELFAGPWVFPTAFRWENYVNAWITYNMKGYVFNSVGITIICIGIVILIGSMASYAISRYPFKISVLFFFIFLAGLAIPQQLVVLPLYIFFSKSHLLDTRIGLILVYTAWRMPFTILVLTAFFKQLPEEIEEAAIIDGCSEFQVFFNIGLPLCSPGIITVTILNLLDVWNEYLFALVFIFSEEKKTLPLGLYSLSEMQRYAADWTSLFAGLVISLIPLIVIYAFLGKRIVSGLTVGAIKG